MPATLHRGWKSCGRVGWKHLCGHCFVRKGALCGRFVRKGRTIEGQNVAVEYHWLGGANSIAYVWLMRWDRERGKLAQMCDYSLHNVKSRPAKVGDKLTTRDFGTGTRGFAALEDASMAVCVLPGTELAFAGDVACVQVGLLGWKTKQSTTKRRSFVRSTRTSRPRITMRSNFRMGARYY